MNKPVILCVDDERIVLNSLKTELKEALGSDYIVETAEGGIDALDLYNELIEDNYDVPLVISDYVMPDKKGDEVLIEIHEINKSTLKIMLTGQATTEGVTNVINKGQLYRYIAKPWESKDFIMTVKEAIRSFYQDRRLEQQNEELRELNENLERKVAERTKELNEKNLELEKLSIVASNTDNGVIIANSDGVIEWVNKGFTELTGYSLQSYIEEVGDTLQKTSSKENFNDLLIDCISEKKSISYTYFSEKKSGREIWLQTNLSPIFNENGDLYKIIVVESDVTKIKKAEEEITNLFDIAIARKDEIEKQRDQINEQNTEIKDSIEYAKRIQMAILPQIDIFAEYFQESFILYKPKDIVSGDFFWIAEVEKQIVFAVADCTGHGVPGAFMSMLGSAFLKEIIINEYITKPDLILKRLRKEVINALGQKGKIGEAKDGMDISLINICFESSTINFSGANNPLYIVTGRQSVNNKIESLYPNDHSGSVMHSITEHEGNDSVLLEVKGDRMPIGIHENMNDFRCFNFQFESGDKIYMSTDGFPDQFGGSKGKKYKYKPFKSLILSNSDKDFSEQQKIIEEELNSWMTPKDNKENKCYDQIDDITLVAIQF